MVSPDPLRERLDWMERHVEDMHVEEPLFAALRAVLDELDADESVWDLSRRVYRAIDAMLPG